MRVIFIFYKVLTHYSVCQFPVSWARQCEGPVLSDCKSQDLKSCHRRTIKQNALHPPGLRDAIIMPEATLAAVTASVN